MTRPAGVARFNELLVRLQLPGQDRVASVRRQDPSNELRRLHEVVIARFPQLAPPLRRPDQALAGFGRAFLRLGHLGPDRLNDKHMLTSWVDNAVFWLRDHQIYPAR